MNNILQEATKQQLIDKSKKADSYSKDNQGRGRNRYERRRYSHIPNQVRSYNDMNMNQLFKDDILTVNLEVKGETDNYIVKIKFGGILENIRNEVKRSNLDEIEFKLIWRSLVYAFNRGNVYIWCSCPDFKYRFNYWATVKEYQSGKPFLDPGKGIANPNDSKGAGCKHIMLVLANVTWLMKVASTVNNYINYMKVHQERLYQKIMYPALFGKQFKKDTYEPINVSNDNRSLRKQNQLKTDKDTLDKSNQYGADRTKYKKGNQSGIQFSQKDNDEDIKELDH